MQFEGIFVLSLALLLVGADSECQQSVNELAQKINTIEAKLALSEARQDAVRIEFSKELTQLDRDLLTAKTMTKVLAEDDFKMTGEINMLKGMDSDVRALKRTVNKINTDVEGVVREVKSKIDGVTASLRHQADANQRVTVLLSSQMRENHAGLEDIKKKYTALESKESDIDNKIASMQRLVTSTNTNGGNGEELTKLKADLESFMQSVNATLTKMRGQVDELVAVVLM